MSDGHVDLIVNGRAIAAPIGTTVAAALLNAGVHAFRVSESGEARAPLCGMGICYECRVTIDGVPHRRACMTLVAADMQVSTQGAA